MNDEQIQKLARKYAEEAFVGCYGSGIDDAVDYVERHIYRALTKLIRTHCIVNKSEVKEEYESWKVFMQTSDADRAKFALAAIKEIFGTELFKERSEE